MMLKKSGNLSEFAVKNSFYSLSSTIIAKIGGFVLTILLARILLPEAFGIYALTLSIIVIVFSFTDFGIGETTVKFVSESIGKNKKSEAFSYFWYFFKIEVILILIGASILLLLSKLISYNLFGKPEVFIPLMFGVLFLIVNSFRSFFGMIIAALNQFSASPTIYLILHGTKVLFSLLALYFFSGITAVSAVFAAFSASSFVSLISIFLILKKRKINLIPRKKIKISNKPTLKYLGFMSLTTVSLVILGSIDVIMLGIFVDSQYIGYYQAAFSMAVSLVAVISSLLAVLFPIFTHISGRKLKRGFIKPLRYIILLSIPAVIGSIFLAEPIISLFFGEEYLSSVSVFYILSFLLLVTPCTILCSSLFKAKGKAKIIATITLISIFLNVILNYFLITSLLEFGPEMVILGVATATLISRIFYLSAILVKTKKHFKVKIPKKPIIKTLLSTLVMAIFLSIYNLYIEINILTGIIEIFVGALIYFLTLFFIKGIGEDDFRLARSLMRRKFNNTSLNI